MKPKVSKTVVARVNTRLRALRESLRSPDALLHYAEQNIREALRRVEDTTRPVVVWTYRVNLTPEQLASFQKMSGWEVMGMLHHVVDNKYALVARAVDRSCYGVLYPTGELERSVKKREFELRRGNWSVPRTVRAPAMPRTEVIYGAREPAPAGPVKPNTMWESISVGGR